MTLVDGQHIRQSSLYPVIQILKHSTPGSVCMCRHHLQQNMDQPGKVANPDRGQLMNREK